MDSVCIVLCEALVDEFLVQLDLAFLYVLGALGDDFSLKGHFVEGGAFDAEGHFVRLNHIDN